MKLAALFSGGKDSTYAIYKALSGQHKILVLITLSSKKDDSYMFHFPNVALAQVQAENMGMEIIYSETSGEEDKELADLKKAIKKAKEKYGIEGVICGALASEYQKSRVDKICKELNLASLAPFWKIAPEKYMRELLENNFKFVITGVAAEGIDKSWLGREINQQSLKELECLSKKFKFHLGGEGGEYETFVIDCPLFKKPLKIKKAEKIWDGNSGRMEIQELE